MCFAKVCLQNRYLKLSYLCDLCLSFIFVGNVSPDSLHWRGLFWLQRLLRYNGSFSTNSGAQTLYFNYSKNWALCLGIIIVHTGYTCMKTHKKEDCRFLHGIAVLVIDICSVLHAERPCWDWWSVWLSRNACSLGLGWAGCHVAKNPELWAAYVWQQLLGHAGAAPLRETPCEELSWGWLAVEVHWCCWGGVVWLPVHVVVEYVAVPERGVGVIWDMWNMNASPNGQDSVVTPNIGLPVGSSLLQAKPKLPLSPPWLYLLF